MAELEWDLVSASALGATPAEKWAPLCPFHWTWMWESCMETGKRLPS